MALTSVQPLPHHPQQLPSVELSEKTLRMATSVSNEVIRCQLSNIRLSNLFLHKMLDGLPERQNGVSTDTEILANGIKNYALQKWIKQNPACLQLHLNGLQRSGCWASAGTSANCKVRSLQQKQLDVFRAMNM